MKIFVTYSDENYSEARDFCMFTARKFACFDKCFAFSPNDIDSEFKKLNGKIFSYKRGAGLWLWKPYIIKKMNGAIAPEF